MEEAEIIGLELLSDSEREILMKTLTEEYPKIQRQVKNLVKLKLQIKTYKKDGPKKKYSLNLSIETPNKVIKSSDANWNFAKVLHKVITQAKTEIEHIYRVSEQGKDYTSSKASKIKQD
jgi:hypothetical protein